MSDSDVKAQDRPALENAQPFERLLIVDDDKAVRDAVHLLMTAIGFEVVSVDSGRSAVELFENSSTGAPIDWAIIDVSMPGMDGIETVQRIRDLHPALPIILATGYTDKAVPAEVIAHQNTALVRKPYRSEAVLEVLETLK